MSAHPPPTTLPSAHIAAACEAGETIPLLAPTIDGLLRRGLPASHLLALGWILRHGARIAAAPEALRPAMEKASSVVCAERLMGLCPNDADQIRWREPMRGYARLVPLLGLKEPALPPPDLERLAAMIQALDGQADGLDLPGQRPPEEDAPGILHNFGKPRSPYYERLLSGAMPTVVPFGADLPQDEEACETVAWAAVADRDSFPATATARLEILRGETVLGPLANAMMAATIKASRWKPPISFDLERLTDEEGPVLSSSSMGALGLALARNLPPGCLVAGRLGRLSLPNPEEDGPRSAKTPQDLVDQSLVLWQEHPQQDGWRRIALESPCLRERLPALAACRGAAAWLEEDEIRLLLLSDNPTPPPLPPRMEREFRCAPQSGTTTPLASVPWLQLRRAILAEVTDLGDRGFLEIPDGASAHGRLRLAARPALSMLRQTLGHGILAFRRAGTVLVVHVPSGHLLLLEAT